jgi:hypothetical protein
MRRTILCFGTEVEGDDTPFRVCGSASKIAPGFTFVKCESPIDLMAYAEEDEIIILDTVKGIRKVKLFEGIEDFLSVRSVTAHDLDLGTFLKVIDGMGLLKRVKIIGIPFGSSKQDVAEEVRRLLSSQV